MEKKLDNTLNPFFTEFEMGKNWCFGQIGDYKFEAKLYDIGSIFGIDEGRVSKLYVTPLDNSDEIVILYDRGWGTKPKDEHHKLFSELMTFLENSPKRF